MEDDGLVSTVKHFEVTLLGEVLMMVVVVGSSDMKPFARSLAASSFEAGRS